mgnify:CR=1 FL=1
MDNSKKTLIFGIISLATAWFGYGSIIAIIFGILAQNEYKKFAATGGVDKKATIGKNLGLAGLIIGIVSLVIVVIVMIVLGAAGCAAASEYSSYSALMI